jgi:hypothetical protein
MQAERVVQNTAAATVALPPCRPQGGEGIAPTHSWHSLDGMSSQSHDSAPALPPGKDLLPPVLIG